jgi:hypothetical protein
MVGQDLTALGKTVDWIKVMVYAHTLGPAGMPYELLGLAEWLVKQGVSEGQALGALADACGLTLPGSLANLRAQGLNADALQAEMRRGKHATTAPLLAGIELVDVPGVTYLNPAQVQGDSAALLAAGAAGLSLSWDLWWMPVQYQEAVGKSKSLYPPPG